MSIQYYGLDMIMLQLRVPECFPTTEGVIAKPVPVGAGNVCRRRRLSTLTLRPDVPILPTPQVLPSFLLFFRESCGVVDNDVYR